MVLSKFGSENLIMAWICVHTQSRQEVQVQARLLHLALEVFLPFRRVTVPDKARPGHSKSTHIPRFPRYLFADVDQGDFAEVPLIRGVSQVVTTRGWDDQPQYLIVPQKAISLLRDPPRPSLMLGDLVSLRGPYQGLQAIIHSIAHLDTTGSVSVWLDMLGGQRSVSVHHSLIQAGARVSA